MRDFSPIRPELKMIKTGPNGKYQSLPGGLGGVRKRYGTYPHYTSVPLRTAIKSSTWAQFRLIGLIPVSLSRM